MLTRRGTLLLAAAVGLAVAGRLLGQLDLYVLATAAALAVAGAVVYVHTVPFALEPRRNIRPLRVPRGSPCRVDLELHNDSRRRVPVLTAFDPIGTAGLRARLAVPALEPGGSGRAAYQLPTERRGRYSVGPLRLVLNDPFGLAAKDRPGGTGGTVVVYPQVELIPALPAVPGYDPHAGPVQRSGRAQGEEFFALRPYEVGDDLRRVHWPSSARSDELMIRQVELPWQPRVAVILDVRRSVHDRESFERCVSAAASVLSASFRSGAYIRLATTAGFDSGYGNSHPHWEALLSMLAGVGTTGNANLMTVLSRHRHTAGGATMAVITTDAAGAVELEAVRALRERAGLVVLVLDRRNPVGGPVPRSAGAVRVVSSGSDQPLVEAWNADPVLAGYRRRRPLASRR